MEKPARSDSDARTRADPGVFPKDMCWSFWLGEQCKEFAETCDMMHKRRNQQMPVPRDVPPSQ